ncbi:MAG: acyl-CoA dehydrogenase [Gammaproteobacteria bacterium]|nr:acyl-CoA dehydrogenase [Gammaproteobacteria bacterium]MYD81537.1 acyl-CoA dehydrogenase [Gammaproteobacteria bacterium]
MDFAWTSEQEQLRDTVAQFLEARCPTTHTREFMDSELGYDRSLWVALGRDMGLGGIHAPEEFGGAGLSYAETCAVLEQMGRALYSGPYFSSNVLAVNALLVGDSSQSQELSHDVVTCVHSSTVAFIEKSVRWDLKELECSEHDGRINGQKSFVLNGSGTDIVLVIARCRSGSGFGLYAVQEDSVGLSNETIRSLDLTRRLTRITLENVEASKLAEWNESKHQEFLDLALIALANEMAGGAQRMLDSALEYASTRVQFGRTIGSLQAIKHKCSEMLLNIELARSAAFCAARSVSDASERTKMASMAKAMASDAYMKVAAECIQIHGGIGFTWENDTHLWYRRAKSSEVYLGDAPYHRELYLQASGV